MKNKKNRILYFLLYYFIIVVSIGCNRIAGNLGINKFDMLPPSSEEAARLFEKVKKESLIIICTYGDLEDIKKILNKNMLSDNSCKKDIDVALLNNLYIFQEKKGGNYTYNKSLATWIEKNRQIKVYKRNPTEKAIYYYPYELKDKVYYKLEFYEEGVRANWKTYTKACASLVSYHQQKGVSKADLEESFLSLVKLAKEGTKFARLFLDYTKAIKSIEEPILTEIINNDYFQKSIVLSQHLTIFFIQIGEMEHAKNFSVITEKLLNGVKKNALPCHNFDQACNLEACISHHNWNYGLIMLHEHSYKEAEKYFIKVYNMNKNDAECIKTLFSVYCKLDARKAWAWCDAHPDVFRCAKILRNIAENTKLPSCEEVKEFSYTDMTSIIMTALLYTDNEKQEADYKDLIKTKILADKREFRKLPDEIQIKIKLADAYSNIYDKNLKEHLKKLSSVGRVDLLYRTSIIYANSGHYNEALECIKIAMQDDLSNRLLLDQKEILENSLIAPTQKALESTSITHETTAQLPTQPAIIRNKQKSKKENTESDVPLSTEEAFATNDSQKIHQYFQKIKREISKQEVLNPLESSNSNAHKIGWLIDDKKTPIQYAQAIRIGYTLFAAIHPNLEEELKNNNSLGRWKGVLNKGYVNAKKGDIGIKGLGNKIYEAKDLSAVTEGIRLIASKEYINESRNKLMLFDKILNHNEVPRYLVKCSFEEIPCPNYYE
ncbi:hypothetical protein [Candidatus Cardinium hertigii]|uniref:Tetratricopeptide repeat protein n=1 Tax=Candidatus Cardinium hertigii TaxID=247481 RepID=A0A2Z3L780_9BACT|nr:hypothetical protein [Candidatus Cardinium hertigii]AWN81568.1 hypothetical protein DK880_00236 [Candidatus Cardinium hertigii]